MTRLFNFDQAGPEMVFPSVDNMSLAIYSLHTISQDFCVREENSGRTTPLLNGEYLIFLGMIPEPDSDFQMEIFLHLVARKFPLDQKSLPFGGIFLARVGRSYVGAGQKTGIHPFLLYVEIISTATGKT